MNNGLGINFLRYVCEEDQYNWSQVFARLPFDEEELKQKGALFGVVGGKKEDGWADRDVELTNWVEEYFNKTELVGDLGGFFLNFEKEFFNIDCLWVWIFWENETRKVKIVGTGKVKIVIDREGREINFTNSLVAEKVLAGEIMEKDIIRMWIGDLDDKAETWETQVVGMSGSVAALKISVLALPQKSADVEILLNEKNEEEKEGVSKVTVEETKPEVEVLAGDNYVGKIGWKEKIKNLFLKKRRRLVVIEDGRDEVVLKVENNSKRKWSMILGFGFLVMLVVSIFVGGVRRKTIVAEKKWMDFSAPIEKSLLEAETLVVLNQAGAKKIVETTRSDFVKNKGDFDSDKYKEKVKELDMKIEASWIKVSGEKNGNLKEVVNLELIRAGVNANKISFVEGSNFVVTSSENGMVMSVNTKQKEVKVLAGKGAGLGWIDSVSDGKKTYIMNKGGVFIAGDESSSLTFDSAVTSPVSLSKFGSNLYLLESGNKEVFKYQIGETSFGERVRWLKEGQLIGVSPIDMDIDVDVWVLGKGGQVERFRRGVKESYNLSNLPTGVEFEKITVEKEGDRIALLNTRQGIVVFCKKTSGACGEQIKVEKLKEAKDIEFDAENNLIVLFGGSIGMLN